MLSRTISLAPRPLILKEITAVTLVAGLTALGAQIAVRVPFSPVPVTMQVVCVIAAGLYLGSRRGLAGQLAYLAAGALGLPVFAGATGGLAVLMGPTGGYLLAFPPAAFVAGWLSERNTAGSLAAYLAALSATALIYAGGALWLSRWLAMSGLASATLHYVWQLGVAPFILVDLLKALLVATSSGPLRALFARSVDLSGPLG
jgi:biotin transport system substrate-specific component